MFFILLRTKMFFLGIFIAIIFFKTTFAALIIILFNIVGEICKTITCGPGNIWATY